jgi:hypothetical protein
MLTEKQRAQTAARQQRFRDRQEQARQCQQEAKGLPAMPAIATIPGQSRWRAAFVWAHTLLTRVQVEMQTYYDARSEAWQEGEAGAQFVERQEALEAILTALEDLTL